MAIRRCASVLLLLAVLGAAVAEDAPPERLSPQQAAERAERAHGADDAAAIEALAARVDPDPWLTARALLQAGHVEAAARFAAAVPSIRRGRLPAEVEAWRTRPEGPEIERAYGSAWAHFERGELDAAREALAAAAPHLPSSVVRFDILKARVRLRADRSSEHRAALERHAERARDLGWKSLAANAYFAAGQSAGNAREWAEAFRLFQVAWSLAEQAKPPLSQALFLRKVAYFGRHAGRSAEALVAARRAVAIYRAAGQARLEARVLNLLGILALDEGAHAEAEAAHRRSLRIHVTAGNARGQVIERVNLARVLIEMGRYHEAEEVLEPALARVRAPEQRRLRAEVLRTLGNAYYRRGESARAIRSYETSLALAKDLEDTRATALALHGLGGAYREVGQFEAARAALEESIQLKLERGDDRGAARSLSLLGIVHIERNDFASAQTAFDLSLAHKRKLDDRPGIAQTLHNRGFLHARMGRLADARRDLGEALDICTELGLRAMRGNVLAELGDVALLADDVEGARAFHDQAVASAEELGSDRHLLYALESLIATLRRQGDHAATLATARRAYDLILTMQGGLGDEQTMGFRERHRHLIRYGVEAAHALGRIPDVFHLMEAGRAGALLALLGGRGLMDAGHATEALLLAERDARVAERRALQELTLALGRGDAAAVQGARTALAEARARVTAAIAALRAEAKETTDVFYPRPIPLADYQALLEPGDAYVAFELGGDTAYALVATRERAAVVGLGSTAALRQRLARLRFDAPGLLDADGLAALEKALIAPLALPAGTKRVLLSPTRELAAYPFAVSWPDKALAYVPSATTHALLAEGCTRCGKGILAVGDPVYPDGATVNGVALERLPHTTQEVELVGDQVVRGADATIDGLRLALKRRTAWSGVHIACHAVMSAEQPRASALALTPGPDDPGLLTVRDVFRLKVPADLVVLSACESGVGAYRGGEGLTGFTRAFMFAGSSRVIASLWMVDDEATSALMKKFYELWRTAEDGTPSGNPTTTAKALRDAQAWLRSQERWKHPYYWAAWSLWGVPE